MELKIKFIRLKYLLRFATALHCTLILFGFENSAVAKEEIIALSATNSITPIQIQEIWHQLPKTETDQIFFHWTSIETGKRWAQQGHIDKGEVDFYNTPNDIRQVHGAGLNLAATAYSSKYFGEYPVVFHIKKDTPIYQSQVIEKVLGFKLNTEEMTELGKHIPFIRQTAPDWWITHNPTNTSHIEYAGHYGAYSAKLNLDFNNLLGFYKGISKIKAFDPQAEYLESLYHLMYYMDGISLYRAIQVAPDNPWSQFEPHLFENYRSLRQDILNKTRNKKVSNLWGGEKTRHHTKQSWATQFVDERLKYLYQRLMGTSDYSFRQNAILVGGLEEGNRFKVSPIELTTLLKNPYLKINYEVTPDGSGFYVNYEYPDISRIADFKKIISPELFEKVIQNPADRSLNALFLRELTINLFEKIYLNKINPAQFLRDFISIHPYSDGNGRISRLTLEEEMLDSGVDILPPMFLSDFDIMFSDETVNRIIKDSNDSYTQLAKFLLNEMYANLSNSQNANYFDSEAWKVLFNSLSIFGINQNVILNKNHLDDIYNRSFHQLLTEVHGVSWSVHDSQDTLESLQLIKKYKLDSFSSSVIAHYSKIVDNIDFNTASEEEIKYLTQNRLFFQGLPDSAEIERRLADRVIEYLTETTSEPSRVLQAKKSKFLDTYIVGTSEKNLHDTLNNLKTQIAEKTPSTQNNTNYNQIIFYLKMSDLINLASKLDKGLITQNEFLINLREISQGQQITLTNLSNHLWSSILKNLDAEAQIEFLKLANIHTLGIAAKDQATYLLTLYTLLKDDVFNREDTFYYLQENFVYSLLHTKLENNSLTENILMTWLNRVPNRINSIIYLQAYHDGNLYTYPSAFTNALSNIFEKTLLDIIKKNNLNKDEYRFIIRIINSTPESSQIISRGGAKLNLIDILNNNSRNDRHQFFLYLKMTDIKKNHYSDMLEAIKNGLFVGSEFELRTFIANSASELRALKSNDPEYDDIVSLYAEKLPTITLVYFYSLLLRGSKIERSFDKEIEAHLLQLLKSEAQHVGDSIYFNDYFLNGLSSTQYIQSAFSDNELKNILLRLDERELKNVMSYHDLSNAIREAATQLFDQIHQKNQNRNCKSLISQN